MNVLDLFSGIGAVSLAARHIGARVVAHSEIDKACQAVLKKHFPDTPQLGDIEKVNPNDIHEPIDILAGGSPCQDLSIAGRGAALVGTQSRLWYEQLRLAATLKPRWLVWENVPNALATNGGRDFLAILRGLDECGYHVAWRILDARYFGVPQRRRRIFLVASLGSGRCSQVLFDSASLPGTSRTRPLAWETTDLAPTLAASASGTARTAGRQENEADYLIWQRLRSNNFKEGSETSSTLVARDKHDYGDLLSFNPSRYLRGFGSELHETEIANTLQANKGRGFSATDEHIILSFSPATYNRGFENAPLKPTTVASTRRGHKKGSADSDEFIVTSADGQIIRRFTPLECERLMGFPDGWTEGHSDTARYSMLGNSIAVPNFRWIFEGIQKADAAE